MRQTRKVVIVSGGSRGLGQALVADFLKADYIVATFSRSATPFIDKCLKQDPDATSFFWQAVDGTDFEQIRQFALAVIRRYGRVDVLINNAAIVIEGLLTMTPDADIHRSLTLNVESVIHLTRICLKSMLAEKHGCVINISSINGVRGHRGVSVYSATKAALDGLTRSLAREMGPEGIRVNTVAPGYFASDMTGHLTEAQQAGIIRRTPLKRLGTVEDLVGVIRFLMSPEASFITGQTIMVDGGISC